MSIQDMPVKINSWLNDKVGKDIYLIILIILVAFASYGLGRLSKIEEGRGPVRILEPTTLSTSANLATPSVDENIGNFVASKNGSKYHLPWCSGAERIKEENKIYFATKEEAERAGYSPAANCKGL